MHIGKFMLPVASGSAIAYCNVKKSLEKSIHCYHDVQIHDGDLGTSAMK